MGKSWWCNYQLIDTKHGMSKQCDKLELTKDLYLGFSECLSDVNVLLKGQELYNISKPITSFNTTYKILGHGKLRFEWNWQIVFTKCR